MNKDDIPWLCPRATHKANIQIAIIQMGDFWQNHLPVHVVAEHLAREIPGQLFEFLNKSLFKFRTIFYIFFWLNLNVQSLLFI